MGTRPFPHTHVHLTPSQGLRVVPSEAQTQDEAPGPRSEGANLCVHTYTDPGLEAGALVPSGSCQVTPLPSVAASPAASSGQDTVPGHGARHRAALHSLSSRAPPAPHHTTPLEPYRAQGPTAAALLPASPLSPPVPGPPMGILFPEVRTTSVRLIWQPPAAPNGIILGEPSPCPGPREEGGGVRRGGGKFDVGGKDPGPRRRPQLLESGRVLLLPDISVYRITSWRARSTLSSL